MKHPLHKFLFLFAFCFLQSAFCNAQNLVPNPSFEYYDICPNSAGEITYATGWLNMCSSTLPADYYNSCCSIINSFSVPYNMYGYQLAANGGNAYCGLVTYYRIWVYDHPNYREYIGALLNNTLNIGQKYYLSLKVSLANMTCASNNIGILFSTVPYNYNSFDSISISIKNLAHLNSSIIITDTLNWTTISGSFIADSSYKYIIIGNFFDDNNTNISSSFNNCEAYYYVDDVCLSLDSLTCNPLDAISKINIINNIVNVYPNPISDKITIDISEPYKSSDIIIYDLPGKKIITSPVTPDKNQIDLSNLSPGVYFISINFNNQAVIKKIVKL
jgi:hypothetical protein